MFCLQIRRYDPNIASAMIHRNMGLTNIIKAGEIPAGFGLRLVAPLIDYIAHVLVYHVLWYFCGVSALLLHTDSASEYVSPLLYHRLTIFVARHVYLHLLYSGNVWLQLAIRIICLL